MSFKVNVWGAFFAKATYFWKRQVEAIFSLLDA